MSQGFPQGRQGDCFSCPAAQTLVFGAPWSPSFLYSETTALGILFCYFVLGTESRASPTSDKYTDHQVSPQPTAPLLSQLNFFFFNFFFWDGGGEFWRQALDCSAAQAGPVHVNQELYYRVYPQEMAQGLRALVEDPVSAPSTLVAGTQPPVTSASGSLLLSSGCPWAPKITWTQSHTYTYNKINL